MVGLYKGALLYVMRGDNEKVFPNGDAYLGGGGGGVGVGFRYLVGMRYRESYDSYDSSWCDS